MALDNFRTIELIWDKANKSIIKTIRTASSDTTGRYFSVKVLDEGQEVDLTGAKLQLYWEHPNFNTNGTDDFTTVDTKGKFTLTFSDEMLTNIGELNAHLVLMLSDGKITSDGFTIVVFKGADGGVVVPTNGNGLVKQIDDKIDKGNVTLTDLTQEVKLAMTGGAVAIVGEDAIGTENIKDSAVTMEKLSFTAADFDEVDDLLNFKNDVSTLIKSKNLLNSGDENFENSSFISPTTGETNSNASYDTTGFIPVTSGKKIIKTHITGNARVKGGMRFIASFDANLNIMPTSGSNVEVFDFTIPDGAHYVRVSYVKRSDFTEPMITELDVSDNSIPPYEAYFKPYYDTEVSTDKTLSTLGVPADAKAVGDTFAEMTRNISPYKNPSEFKKVETLSATTPIMIADFPEMLKTGQSISYTAKLIGLGVGDKIEIGFINSKYATYQSWLEITSDRVKWLLSGSNAILNNEHNLTIRDYVDIKFKVTTDTGQLEILIVTNGGSYSFEQTSDSTRFNAIGTLTARATVPTSDVTLSGACTQFQCDTWLIGDSYFGSGPSRIGGKLMEWGYSDNVLIDGLGGLNSTQAYAEFQKLLKYGTPKTLVWYLGMNDNGTTVSSHFPLVEELCDQNGIELIFNRIPLVPTRLTENNAVNNYVMASGRRYIDSYSAVGANASGVWYSGHLSSDGVHPDPLGASALTARMISDVPEILA